jgi:lysozyme
LACFAAAAVLGAVAVMTYNAGLWRFHYPSPSRYPIRGVDVSHHQGEIDWVSVRSHDLKFAYVKATEGGDFVDPLFERNWREAQAAGLVHGAYHFFSLCREPEMQAQNFLRTVPVDPSALPAVVDLEFGGNCSKRSAKAVVCHDVQTFVERVEAALGKAAIYYATDEFLSAYDGCLPKRQLWVRAIAFAPSRAWVVWQFANRARVPGIVGPVDLDVFGGDSEDLERLRNLVRE